MYTPQTFTIPTLTGISQKNIDEHLKLYEGYVKNTNKILELLADPNLDAYAKSEAQRRFSFEFNGMKNHEYYFNSFENGPSPLVPDSALGKAIAEQWGSFDSWLTSFKTLAKTRGIGWAILYYDRDAQKLHNVWIDEQHLGHLNSCQYIMGIDMWEHAYVADYQPSGKAQYIEDYFANVNWKKAEELF
jgi:Fe-Mn family superoxide dismutase